MAQPLKVTERDHQAKKTSRTVDIVHRLLMGSKVTVRSNVFRKLFMESVLLKANLVNLSTGQYWLKIDRKKGMSDREGHGHKAVLYKSHFPPLRHSFSQRHHCIHRLINHVYN